MIGMPNSAAVSITGSQASTSVCGSKVKTSPSRKEMPRSAATIEDAADLAKASGRDNVGILLDTLHLSRSGGSPASVAALPAELMLYVQLCDAPAVQPVSDADAIVEARGARLLPGEGDLWLKELMATLPNDVWISVETPHASVSGLSFTEMAQRAMDATRRFLGSLPG